MHRQLGPSARALLHTAASHACDAAAQRQDANRVNLRDPGNNKQLWLVWCAGHAEGRQAGPEALAAMLAEQQQLAALRQAQLQQQQQQDMGAAVWHASAPQQRHGFQVVDSRVSARRMWVAMTHQY
jgi:hypothetical protein